MRIRYKKWARPELEASKFYIDNPENGKENGKNFSKIQIIQYIWNLDVEKVNLYQI